MIAQAGQGIVLGADAHGAVDLGVLQGDRGLAGEELGELELVGAEGGLRAAHPADVERADRLAVDEQRDDDHRLGLERRPGHLDRARVEVGLVGQDRLAMLDHPAGDPGPERALVGQDQVGEPVAGDDRPADAGGAVDPVHRQRVVRHDRLERVGDQVQDAGRLEGRQEPFVDLEEAALAVELVLELHLLAMEALHVGGVEQRVGGVAGEDVQRRLVVAVEAVASVLGDDQHAVDGLLVGHRHEQSRLGPVARHEVESPRVAARVAEPERLAVRRDPAREALADRHPQRRQVRARRSLEGAVEGDRLAHPGLVVHEVDPDRVVVDQPSGLGDDRPGDAVRVLEPVQPAGQLRDRAQALGERPASNRPGGRC